MNKKKGAAKNGPPWESIFRALKGWRGALQKTAGTPGSGASPGEESPGGAKDPSVSTVAEIFNQDPWAVLASTIISLRTKDEVTMVCSRALLEKAPGPGELLALSEEETARLIYPAGFYRTKAGSLRKIAAIVLEKYGGRVPSDMEQLLALPGVGRKTANLVLTEAFNKEGLCVDIHVHRISNRNGWVCTSSPEETEMSLRALLPKKYWKPINPLLVLYGQKLCRPVSPYCSRCVIYSQCQRNGVDRSR